MGPVALLGFGRFGRALSGLLSGAGVPHRVFDPETEVPPALRAGSLSELCEGAGLVVLAVPVPGLRATLEALRPHLSPVHTVLDVGSVKVRPVQDLASVLGRDIPWVGTHPLFGPNSLARGERPLRVVVCPNTEHPGAALKARELYARLGCEVLELSPDAHDEVMARTHALTQFLARGLLEAGAGEAVPFAPPSFAPVTRLVESARAEAPHLLATVQSENPHAREARERLLDALTRLHQELDAPSSTREHYEPVMTVLGTLWGRDTLFLDAVDFDYPKCLTLRGKLDGTHASVPSESDDIPFELRFHRPLLVRMVELDFSGLHGRDCFVEVKNSRWLEEARRKDPSAKLSPGHRHYIVRTYDDVFEVVCASADILIDVSAAR